MPTQRNVTYDRPVAAKLTVSLDNGETWEATPEDLRHFGYVSRSEVYRNFRGTLISALDGAGLLDDDTRRDLTDTELNPLRYLVEVAVSYPDELPRLAQRSADDAPSVLEQIADIERRLRATKEA